MRINQSLLLAAAAAAPALAGPDVNVYFVSAETPLEIVRDEELIS